MHTHTTMTKNLNANIFMNRIQDYLNLFAQF